MGKVQKQKKMLKKAKAKAQSYLGNIYFDRKTKQMVEVEEVLCRFVSGGQTVKTTLRLRPLHKVLTGWRDIETISLAAAGKRLDDSPAARSLYNFERPKTYSYDVETPPIKPSGGKYLRYGWDSVITVLRGMI